MSEDTSLREKDRIQGMVRSINQYRNGDPKAICAGSDAQILYAMTDARHDVLVLWDFAVAAGIASEAKDRRIEALEAVAHPLADIAQIILAEAPPDADEFTIFTDSQGCHHKVTLAGLRSLVAALSGKEGQS